MSPISIQKRFIISFLWCNSAKMVYILEICLTSLSIIFRNGIVFFEKIYMWAWSWTRIQSNQNATCKRLFWIISISSGCLDADWYDLIDLSSFVFIHTFKKSFTSEKNLHSRFQVSWLQRSHSSSIQNLQQWDPHMLNVKWRSPPSQFVDALESRSPLKRKLSRDSSECGDE